MEDDPAPEGGGEVKRSTTFESLGDRDAVQLRRADRVRERRSQVRHEIKACDECDESDDERLEDVTLRNRQHAREEIEHAGERGERQELVARKDDREEEDHGDEQDRDDERRRMADDERRRHADGELSNCLIV